MKVDARAASAARSATAPARPAVPRV